MQWEWNSFSKVTAHEQAEERVNLQRGVTKKAAEGERANLTTKG